MKLIELVLSKDLKVFVSENGKVISAFDRRPAFDDWGDATMRVLWNEPLLKLVDEEFAKYRAGQAS